MYKCLECGQEYDIKPDFCDCGNDTFEEIVSDEKKEIPKNVSANKSDKAPIEPSYKKNLPSIIFFSVCIILSFIILFFIGNPKDEPQITENKKETAKDIPDIDKLWDNTKAKRQVVREPKIEPQVVKQEPKAEPKVATVELKKEPAKINKPTVVQKQPVQKQVAQKQPAQVSKPVQKPIQQAKTQQTKPQVQQPIKQKPKTISEQTQIHSQPKQQTQTTAQNVQVSKPVQQTQIINPEELKQYKKALRNKIASNIDFLSIAGDGKCSLSFKVSPNGVLTNKNFVSQSQNTSLNDAVYQAMLQVTSFKAPPSAYKNESLKLTVRISGGNFEVSLE